MVYEIIPIKLGSISSPISNNQPRFFIAQFLVPEILSMPVAPQVRDLKSRMAGDVSFRMALAKDVEDVDSGDSK